MIKIDNMQSTGLSLKLRKIVIKLGSAVIAGEQHPIDLNALSTLVDSVAALRQQGVDVILVSSGAIGVGQRQFPEFRSRTLPDQQALAAVGQVGLMHCYKELFNARGFRAAQILLTRDDMANRTRYLNARHTMDRLLELGAVPVVNENDTVTVDEIKFGDNDELSAIVATKMNADLLVLLSVVDGLYATESRGRRQHRASQLLPVVQQCDDRIMGLADGSRSNVGRGGMSSKLQALRMATHAGVHAVIANGKTQGILEHIVTGSFQGTYFVPEQGPRLRGKGRWIAYGQKALGRQLVVDEGARLALTEKKKSLLPAGIRHVRGRFPRGALVEVVTDSGQRIAKGLVNYSSDEIERIKGRRTPQVRQTLGYLDYEEVIHRDNMAMVQ